MVDHQTIVDEIRENRKEVQHLRDEIKPVLIVVTEIREMADIYRAGKVGGNAVKWVASIGIAILAIWALTKGAVGHIIGSISQ